jgi:hypothetical protein
MLRHARKPEGERVLNGTIKLDATKTCAKLSNSQVLTLSEASSFLPLRPTVMFHSFKTAPAAFQ